MTKFKYLILLCLPFLFWQCGHKKVLPEKYSAELSIDSIKMGESFDGYDTLYYSLSPEVPGAILELKYVSNTYPYVYAKPQIISKGNNYLVLNRHYTDYDDTR